MFQTPLPPPLECLICFTEANQKSCAHVQFFHVQKFERHLEYDLELFSCSNSMLRFNFGI